MSKTRISIASIGDLPPRFDQSRITKWKSSLFEIIGGIETFALSIDSDIEDWGYSDAALEDQIPSEFDGDLCIAITRVPLALNWYTRRLGSNRIVFSSYEIDKVLESHRIPLENAVLRVLYAYTLTYRRNNNSVPNAGEFTNFTHDETRGCIFDMNGIKEDIVYSCHEPIICPDCAERCRKQRISNEIIETARKEIKAIRKPLYFRITDSVRAHPIWALVISASAAILLGALGSLLGSLIYARLFPR